MAAREKNMAEVNILYLLYTLHLFTDVQMYSNKNKLSKTAGQQHSVTLLCES